MSTEVIVQYAATACFALAILHTFSVSYFRKMSHEFSEGAMTLTAFTDNAAITYLGSQVAGLSDLSKYALVAGSVVGGGLTVIANAPNPAGYSTLNESFGTDGIKPLHLFLSALIPTLIAAICFWFL